MSADGDTPGGHEIVIIKRGGGDHEEGHHGGAWKIAFADLMTAMMAFFLVMWLLNASDKEKIQQIATYFNPMKLNSKRPTAKGVVEIQDTPKSTKQEKAGSADKPNKDKKAVDGKGDKKNFRGGGDGDRKDGRPDTAEEDLFNDPYGVLAKLAIKASEGKEGGGAGKGPGMNAGADSLSNPFEPFADQSPQENRKESSIALNRSNPLDGVAEPNPDPETKPGGFQPVPGPEAPDALEAAPAPKAPPQAGPKPAIAPKTETKDQVEALQSAIEAALQSMPGDQKPEISVTQTSEGLLISLTDDFRFGMFDTSSSVPRPELVVVMEKIGKILAEKNGDIIVRGHTDARPFKGQKNNNWKLSMDRAQMAYYMLMRGGIAEKRFTRIEGHADRELKVPTDPNAAENRRIEILLKVPKAG